jgi:hypothetical protein
LKNSWLPYKKLERNERYAIAALILATYDDLISELSDPDDRIWKKVVTALDKNREEYIDLLNYWALWHEPDSNNVFSITPLVRAYLK